MIPSTVLEEWLKLLSPSDLTRIDLLRKDLTFFYSYCSHVAFATWEFFVVILFLNNFLRVMPQSLKPFL